MATWKEKGVVPDSEDEEDSDLDSQNNDTRTNISRPTENHDDNEDNEDERIGGDVFAEAESLWENQKEEVGLSDFCETPKEAYPVVESLLGREEEEEVLPTLLEIPRNTSPVVVLSKISIRELKRLRSSSVSPQGVFKVSELPEPGGIAYSSSPGSPSNFQLLDAPAAAPIEDDISRSYVRITSADNSPLSSPPSSRDLRDPTLKLPVPSPVLPQNIRTPMDGEDIRVTSNDYSGIRSLRHRNAIQLHPYMLEQEKYRQTLKARGMVPMRLAATPDDRRGAVRNVSSSPDPDLQSQSTEVATIESQAMDFDWELPSSPPYQAGKNTELTAVLDDGFDDSDDDLPDLHNILPMPRPATSRPEAKQRMRQYFVKHKRPQLASIKAQSSRLNRITHVNDDTDIFDVPASPPSTSPTSTTVSRSTRKFLHHASPLSSMENTPSRPEERPFRVPVDLPTPATSAVKPASEVILVESDIDMNSPDPFPLADSSSDESVQLRKVGRKIRGVLPASHLRLDQARVAPKTLSAIQRQSFEEPSRTQVQRGVAIPRHSKSANRNASNNFGLPLLSDDSEEERDSYPAVVIAENDTSDPFEELFSNQRLGLADEDDQIDAMLPIQKRQQRPGGNQPRKRKRVGSGVASEFSTHIRLPKPTGYLSETQPEQGSLKSQKRTLDGTEASRPSAAKRARKSPPRLGILDVVDLDRASFERQPQFVRIAARTVRCRKGHGRQSPTKKFIRLANREDTVDARSVLQDWRRGRIQPRVLGNQKVSMASIRISTTDQIQVAQQRRAQSQMPKARSNSVLSRASIAPVPRRLQISKAPQRSMDDFVVITDATGQQENHSPIHQKHTGRHRLQSRKPAHTNATLLGRPAQLETTTGEHSRWISSTAFKSTKRSMDSVFEALCRRREPHTNLQLNRFLLDTAAHQSTPDPDVASAVSDQPIRVSARLPENVFRRKRTVPLRMDVSAARYRQPSEPLVLENVSVLETAPIGDPGSKLQGLGKFGTKYPIHFDILPFNSSVYFHQSTLIGSGRLSTALRGIPHSCHNDTQSTFTLGDQTFSWSQWNATTSSEIGVCIDWMVDQLTSSQQSSESQPKTNALDVVDFIDSFVRSHLVFPESHDQVHFLSRMSEVFRDFSARLGEVSRKAHQPWVEVLTSCTIIIYRLLRMSQKTVDDHSLNLEFEALLRTLTSKVVRLLLSDGLDKLRKLYDDLQYFSIRESGLRNDQPVIHAWVVIMKVLNAAHIPRGSFWDVATPILCEVNIAQTKDARVLEKLWYSMFTLLPLCEFDEFGVISSFSRHKASFDNWAIPQKILKRLFELYSSNQRQPPGFNDYCRANLSRCYYLTTEWGWWKCTSIIGSVFDFFASQKLAHLRNEEVYDSPRFLRELDKDISLSLEPEDRSFHILLKMAALAITHMDKIEGGKGIRNLITRLLPNHNRQFPKEEAIHHRELASLRNHHDLLSALYISAPPDQRPSPTLIQDLVIADRSHNEACLINLRAWENLTKFVVTRSSDVSLYRPFTTWQNSLSSALSKQYIEIEREMRRQAESLAKDGKETISETFLRQTIDSNKRSTMEMLRAMIKTMDHTMMSSKHAQMTILALNPRVISTLCSQEILGDMAFTEGLLGDCITVLNHYLKQIDKLQPVAPPQAQISYTADGDSQGSEDMNLSLDRVEMIYRLQSGIIPLIRGILSKGLQNRSNIRPLLLHDTVQCWARLAAKMSEGALNLKDFLISGPNAVFQQRPRLKKCGAYWPLFLSELVEHKDLADLKIPGFDIGTEWLMIITSPPLIETLVVAVNTLTARLRSAGHFLLTGSSRVPYASSTLTALEEQKVPSYILFRSAVDVMRVSLLSQENINSILDDTSPKEAQSRFSTMLKQVMKSMKDYLESMTPSSAEHLDYVKVVQPIISIIRSYASDIQPLLEFFVIQSNYYWPENTDPTMYVAGIVSYSLRLSKSPHRTSPELFHYLYNGWRKDLVEDQTKRHIGFVKKGLSRWEFTLFLLSEFMPAALQVGFESPGGWVLCANYLPALSSRLIKLLEKQDENVDAAFDLSINLLKIITNGLVGVLRSLTNNAKVHQLCIVQVTIRFWLSLILPLRQYSSPDLAKCQLNKSVQTSILNFILSACRIEDDEFAIVNIDSETYQFNNGQHFQNFKSVLREDIESNWEVHDNGFEIAVSGTKARDVTKTHLRLMALIREALTSTQMLGLVVPLLEGEEVEEVLEEFSGLRVGGWAEGLYF